MRSIKPTFALLFAVQLTTHAGGAVTTAARPPAHRVVAPSAGAVQDAGAPPQRVLAVYWYPSDHPTSDTFDRAFHAVLKRESAGNVEYYAEYFESARFPGEEQARIMRDFLRQKYDDRKIDVLLAWGGVPLEFLLTYRNELFPGTPIVAYAGTLEAVRHLAAPPLTGVLNLDAYEKTLELALRLHPETTSAFIITGTPTHDKLVEREAAQQIEKFRDRIALTYLTDLPLDQLIATVKNLSTGSIILFSRQSQEDPGRVLFPSDFLNLISRSAPVPVYSPWNSLLGYGTVGGLVDDPEAGAAKAAEIVLRVAQGARPEDIPFQSVAKVPTFDARQLKRWRIDEARLPPGSVILFREPTVWDQYKGYVVATCLLVLFQTLLIGGLLLQRARRQRAEALLQQSEQRYELATTAGGVGVWDWNLLTNEIYVDPSLKRALGFADSEIDNHIDSWGSRVHPEDASLVHAAAREHIEGRSAHYEVEHRMLHKDGSIRWFLARGSAVRLSDGRAIRIIGTDTDITERKSTEVRLHETQDELTRVSRFTALGELAASIAHEVSQPLSAILMNSRACQRWLSSADPPVDEIRTALQDISTAGHRARELMRRNRELFQNRTVEKLPLDVNAVVGEIAALARARLLRSRVTLSATLDEGLPVVLGDRVELQQVLLNLLFNAIDAMETVDPHLRLLHIETCVTGNEMVRVSVRDSGIGFEDVDTDRMFMPSYTTKPSGTGVGLSISRSIVEAHGGTLWAIPCEGPGATFCFTLPAAAAGAAQPDARGAVRL